MFKPVFRITPLLLKFISLSSELRSWISGTLVDVPWFAKLQRETAARLAHSSTAIEGNPLTLPEVEALARGEEVLAWEQSKREVLNYLSAIHWIWKRRKNIPFREKDLLYLHWLITQKLTQEAGRFKTKQNRIVDSRGVTVYTPPSPIRVPELTQGLLKWLNSTESKDLHPIISSAIAHHRLVSIHPFSDGNGRVARALGVWVLFVRQFDTEHLFSLDEYFEKDRQKYYQKIQQARDLDDDLTYWLEYVAKGVAETLQRTKERIESLRVSARSKIVLTRRQEDLLRFLRDKGRVRTSDIESAFKLTRARINQILKPLVDNGIVQREGKTRATSYRLS